MTRVGQVLLCLLLAGGAYATIRWIQATEPTAQRGAAVKETAMLVEVVPAERGTYSPEIVALGTVEPEREVRLAPRVAGEVLDRHPRLAPGSFVDAQDELLTIDPTDYATAKRARHADHLGAEAGRDQARAELGRARAALDEMRAEVDQARAEVEQAEADLEVEQGRRVVAERDFALLEERFDETQRRLALREPQLAAARARIAVARSRVAAGEARLVAAQAEITAADAALAAAEARVLGTEAAADQAQADFDRTTIVAPFDAHVLSRSADKGSQVSPGDEIAHLVGTAEYQVIATVPLDKLRWIRFPSSPQTKGSRVTIHHEAAWGEGRHREGHVARLVGSLDRTTRMARVLVVVSDPLARIPDPENPDRPPLIVGAVVEARIHAEPLPEVVRIDRQLVRRDDTVWVMREGRLDIRDVEIEFQDPHHAYIRTGLEAGESVVVTNLATVARDAPLRTQGSGAAAAGTTTRP